MQYVMVVEVDEDSEIFEGDDSIDVMARELQDFMPNGVTISPLSTVIAA